MKIFPLVFLVSLLLAACNNPDGVYSDVNLQMSAAPVDLDGLTKTLYASEDFIALILPDTGLSEGEFVSFTPTEVLMDIHTIRLNSSWEFDELNNQFMGKGDWLELPVNTQVNLVSMGDLSSIFDHTYSISDTFFAKYVSMSVGVDQDLQVSGTLTTKNMTYTLDNAVYTFGGIPEIPFIDTVEVDVDQFPSLRIIFDSKNTAYLYKNPEGPVPEDDTPLEDTTVTLIMENALIMPFEGTEDIEIERYAVKVGDYPYYVQVVLGIDQSSDVRLANWLTVFEPGYNEGIGTTHMIVYPSALSVPMIIKNIDQSYVLKMDRTLMPLREGEIDDRSLEFNAFRREDHADTLIFGGIYRYAYTAVKL